MASVGSGFNVDSGFKFKSGALALRLGRPGGYLLLRFAIALPSVYLRSTGTLGLPSVISLAISGRCLVIFADSSLKRKGRKLCSDEMVDFPIRKRYFWGRVG